MTDTLEDFLDSVMEQAEQGISIVEEKQPNFWLRGVKDYRLSTNYQKHGRRIKDDE
jgi:hypothetical protein